MKKNHCSICKKEIGDSFVKDKEMYICLDCLKDNMDYKNTDLNEAICYLCGNPVNEDEYDSKQVNICKDCFEDSVGGFLSKNSLDDLLDLSNKKDENSSGLKDMLINSITQGIEDLEELSEQDPKEKLEKEIEEESIKLKKLSPKLIKEELDKYIIGQDYAKKVLAISLYDHQKRLVNNLRARLEDDEDSIIEKTNIMLLGPTGVGKTATVKRLAKILDVPFTIVDSSSLTSVGYIGKDVDDVLESLIENAGGDIEKAEKGIVFLDEFDKIAKKLGSRPGAKDVGGEAVQQELLKIIEGTKYSVSIGRNFNMDLGVEIDTSNILFILGGSFEGIQDIVKSRLNKEKNQFSLGFGADLEKVRTEDLNLAKEISTEDIKEFGIIPEIIGRAPIICVFEKLSLEELKRILVEPKNSMVDQLTRLIKMEEVDLEFEDEAISEIARYSLLQKTGARGLKGILEKITYPIRYEIPNSEIEKIIVTKETVKNPNKYKVLKKGKQEQM